MLRFQWYLTDQAEKILYTDRNELSYKIIMITKAFAANVAEAFSA